MLLFIFHSFQWYNGDSQSRVVYISLTAYLAEVESELYRFWGYFEHNTFKLKKCLWFYDGFWNSQVFCSWLVTLQKCGQLYFWKERKWSCSVMLDSLKPLDCSLPAPPSRGFSRQEYWSGLPFPSPGDLPWPGLKPDLPHCRHCTSSVMCNFYFCSFIRNFNY